MEGTTFGYKSGSDETFMITIYLNLKIFYKRIISTNNTNVEDRIILPVLSRRIDAGVA